MRFIAEWAVGLLTDVPDYDLPAAVPRERNIEKRVFNEFSRRHQFLCRMLRAYPLARHPNQPALACRELALLADTPRGLLLGIGAGLSP